MYAKTYQLMSMPYANAKVKFIFDDSNALIEVKLISYYTDVLTVTGDTIIVHEPVNCSRTTSRHVNRFTTEMFGRNLYHELKRGNYEFHSGDWICPIQMLERYAKAGKELY